MRLVRIPRARPAPARPRSLPAIALSVAAMLGLPATAAPGDWTFSLSAQGWPPATSITLPGRYDVVQGELGLPDAINAGDIALSAAVEARHGRWSFLLEGLSFDTRADATPNHPEISFACIKADIAVINAYLGYRIMQDTVSSLDLALGLRNTRTDTEVREGGGDLVTINLQDDDWTQPLVALRYSRSFAQDWYGTLFLDAGGAGGGSDRTWQAAATLGRNLGTHFAVEAGYRILDIDHGTGFDTFDLHMAGPFAGLKLRF